MSTNTKIHTVEAYQNSLYVPPVSPCMVRENPPLGLWRSDEDTYSTVHHVLVSYFSYNNSLVEES